MQTKSGFMDDRDENGEYRDYDDVGQTENKRRWGQIFVIGTQVVDANSDIDQDSLLFPNTRTSFLVSPVVSHHNYHVLPLLLFPTIFDLLFRHWPSSGRPWHWVRRSFSKTYSSSAALSFHKYQTPTPTYPLIHIPYFGCALLMALLFAD